jgi:hypothetical protein
MDLELRLRAMSLPKWFSFTYHPMAPPNAHVQISWILLRNAGRSGREKDYNAPFHVHAVSTPLSPYYIA